MGWGSRRRGDANTKSVANTFPNRKKTNLETIQRSFFKEKILCSDLKFNVIAESVLTIIDYDVFMTENILVRIFVMTLKLRRR